MRRNLKFMAAAFIIAAVSLAEAMPFGLRTAMWGVAAAQRQLSTPWVEDDSFNGSVANVYDGWLVDDNGDIAGIIQVKAAKQSVKNGATNITATATVTDLNGKKWSYSKGVGAVDGVVTGLVSTAKDVLVTSFGVELGLNGLCGEWGDCKIVGARNGMGVRGDSMMSALENGYLKKSYSTAFRDEFGVSRLQLVVGAKGAVKVTGNVAGGFKMNASVQGVMGENAFYVPCCAVLKSGKQVKSVSVLVRIAPDGTVEVLGNNLGDAIAAGETLTFDGLDEDKTFYSHVEPPSGEKEYQGQVVIPDLAYPAKFSAKGLPAGLKIDAATGVISGVPTKPGRYSVEFTVVSGLDSKSKVVVKFEIVVPNLTDGMIQVEDEYGPYVPGVSYTNTIVVAADCAVSGLPVGMKWTAKDILDNKTKQVVVPANSAYGAPMKPGKYTVYFTKTVDKVKHTATATFIVGEFSIVNVVTIGSGTGKVTGAGAFAANKKVALKATADTKDDAKKGTKKSVFAGWYCSTTGVSPEAEDRAAKQSLEVCLPVDGVNAQAARSTNDELDLVPVVSTVDFRTASLPYVMTAAPETTLYAMFVTAEEDSDIVLYVDGNEITYNATDNNFVAGGTTILPLQMDSISIPKAAVSGLPAGMKYTDKALTVKATKTEEAYDVPANAIYGMPTKPGLYTVTVKLTNTTVKKAIEKKFTIEVPNMRSGLYNDSLAYETSSYPLVVGLSDLSRYPAFTIPEGAKVSVSGLPAGMKWDAKNGVFAGIPTKTGTFTVTITTTIGRDKFIDTVTLDVEALPENLVGTYTGLIGRDVNVEKEDPWMAYGMANVTVAANGKITAKMTLPCGTYSFSAAGWDYVEDGVYSAVLQTKNGDEFELVIDSKRNWNEIAEDSALLIDGYKEFRVPIWRNEHAKGGKIESDPVANELISEIKALKKVAFKVEGSKSSGYEVTEVASNDRSANLTVTFDTKGGVKYAGNFDGVRVSGSTFLCIDSDDYYTICDIVVSVGKTEAIYISFGIERDEDGELQFEVDVAWAEFQENNRDYDKVQLWEGGPYWATTNIGAEKPWNSGYYFYWGDKDGSSRNFSFSASNTPTMGKDISALQRDGWITLDNVLSPEHDAARVQWGGRWRMPTYEEFKDLNNNCDWDWTIVNGVKGYIVRGRGDYASVSIFFPCAGCIYNSSIELSGSECWYWSSTARSDYAMQYTFSRSFQITKYVHGTGSAYRYYGFLIRPVQGFTK